MPSSSLQGTIWAAKASLISTTSTSSIDIPDALRSFWVAGVACFHGPVLGDDRPLVLLLAGHVAALGHVLRREPHWDVDVVGRAVLAIQLRVLGLVGHARAEPRAGDRLDPGRDVLVALT